MATDIGESLVGSYLRYVVGCEVVVYNTHTPGAQGEIDVIGLRYGDPRAVWLCEVITHLQGTQYGGGYDGTVKKISEKIARARAFAEKAFPGDTHHYEIWTPIAPSGIVTKFDQLAATYQSAKLDVSFVANHDYTERVQRLLDHAKTGTKATSEPAYRMLKILTHLRGQLDV